MPEMGPERGRPIEAEPPVRLRVEATRARQRLATVMQCVVLAAMLGLVWSGAWLVGLFWDERGDPEVGWVLWLFVAMLALGALTLIWLVILIQDLVKVVVGIDNRGVAVDRLLRSFTARWDEIHEVGVMTRFGHLTLRTARGSLTTTARLLGSGPFGELVAALRARAGPAVREWGPWDAARRQLLLLLVPLLGALFVGIFAHELRGRRPPPREGRR